MSSLYTSYQGRSLTTLLIIAGLFSSSPGLAAVPSTLQSPVTQQTGLPKIMVLTTGGTIAGQNSLGSASPLGYTSGKLNGGDLINAVPGIDKIASLQSEAIASIGSQDMNDAVWFRLAEKIQTLAASKTVQGVVITHGTDTLEETAFFLKLVLRTRIPVVLTGAMRPASAPGADGPANLLEAVRVAADPAAHNHGVMVVMNDIISSPVWVTKSDSTNVAAFASPYAGPIGHVDAAGVSYLQASVPAGGLHFALPKENELPRVEIVYSHSNMDATQIVDAMRHDAKGIVLAGVGDGNTSATALAALKQARQRGIVVIRASRTWSGAVKRNVEVNDDEAGFVVSPGLNPAKSRILTQLLIAQGTTSPADVQKAFNAVTQ